MILKISNLTKNYKDKKIFNSLNLEVNSGDFLWIYGKSGAGKSTLLNIIGMLEQDFEGNLKLFNYENPTIEGEGKKILKNDLSYLFQNYGLIDNEDCYYNLNIINKIKGKINKKEMMIEALKEVGLDEYMLEKKVYTLSGGEQQRLAIAKIILKKPKLILCDEPTGSLDEENSIKVMEILKKLNDSGITIIIVSHDKRIEKYANKKLKI